MRIIKIKFLEAMSRFATRLPTPKTSLDHRVLQLSKPLCQEINLPNLMLLGKIEPKKKAINSSTRTDIDTRRCLGELLLDEKRPQV